MSTFYLKYRPQTISQLDLETVRTQLSAILQAAEIPHAFLFSGPRGLGKTSAARILAKAINCEQETQRAGTPQPVTTTKTHTNQTNQSRQEKPERNPPKPQLSREPCNQCIACQSITLGTAPDVIEMDGASNRGIDDIRVLRDTIAMAPVQLRKKVYVIDEVHMLTKEAFNALLKTLEEPPDHVVFVLATTEPDRIPETILSRSFHLAFHRATDQEVIRALQRVVEGESLTVAPEVLQQIATRADGGFRDAHKFLEQLAFRSKTIDLEVYKVVFADADILTFISLLAQQKIQEALAWTQDQHTQGVEIEAIFRELLHLLKDHLLHLYGIDNHTTLPLSQSQTRRLISLCLQQARYCKNAVAADLPLVLLVTQWAEEISATELSPPAPSNPPSAKPTLMPVSPQLAKSSIPTQTSFPVANRLTLAQIQQAWDVVLTRVQQQNRSIATVLKTAQLEAVTGETLSIKVFYEFHKTQLEAAAMRHVVDEACQTQFATKLKIKYILGDKSEKMQLEQKSDADLAKAAVEVFT